MSSKKALQVFREESEGGCCPTGVSLNVQTPKDGSFVGQFGGRAAIVTLGCAKNQVDSEVMLGVLKNRGYEIVNDITTADIAIINTCGFLESSVKESIDAVLEVAEQKEKGRLRRLIVAGCMVERFKGDLKETLPEVDAFILTSDLLKVGDIADGDLNEALNEAGRPYFLYDDTMPRQLATQSHTAYVKISEGCNRPCTFCIIPKIRGEIRSRTLESIVREVAELGKQGVREVNLVAQDLTSYGIDIRGPRLPELLKALNDAGTVDWVRLLYAYPVGTDTALMDAISSLPRICSYIDIPLQHSSEQVLKSMKRPIGKYSPRSIVRFIKEHSPDVSIRTTFIVGFPGETETDIDDLVAFVSEGHFASVGVFTYSREKEAESFGFEGHLSQKVKDKRRERVMLAQQAVTLAHLQSQVGKRIQVMIEGPHEDTDLLLVGRAEFQAPEVDGVVIVNDSECDLETVMPGTMGLVEITEVSGYDLVGTLCSVQ